MKKSFILAMAALITLGLSSCLKVNDDNPVVTEPETDDRISDVIPDDIRTELEEHIPIFDGVNPPNVEGVYMIRPMVADYCSDREAGWTAIETVVRFSNQNMKTNTIDYADYEGSIQTSVGEGAFISGEGNNFTIYFNTEGTSYDIYTRTALVVSGTKVPEGIANLHYAFVMVEKGDDPYHWIMSEGAYRVFVDSDGLSETTEWNPPMQARRSEQVIQNPWNGTVIGME